MLLILTWAYTDGFKHICYILLKHLFSGLLSK